MGKAEVMKFRLNEKLVTMILVNALLVASLLTSACGLRDPKFKLLDASQNSLVSGFANNKVDILWVIDNSGTMGPKQTNLANSINSFMNQFVTKGMDYKIAVTTTDIRPVNPLHPNDPNFSGQAACFVGSPKVITPTTPNPVTALAANAQVGFFGAADAHSYDAVTQALSGVNAQAGGCNEGFLRSDAFLAVIFFSDADEDTAATTNQLITFLDSIKTPITLANGNQARSYFTSGMVVEDLARAACIALGPFSEKGLKFIDAASLTGGIIASICDADFSAGLLSVSTKILEETTAVRLAREPDQATIVVILGGNGVPNSAVNGWTFDSTKNSIVFHGSYIPTSTTSVIINYTPLDVIR